ncbi:unnamed protein product [Tuber melanosporum]|uniref:(Perigord truffle) hypothetical protein n=1 Tax=Tuber melanosporum (strain Mel28) TaxID=656061 RepID=D5GJS4_TUBMM|nr:uncharacterized protein GSTUM_00009171001 [Tuber melanosporum]CAZ84767.1 unnamed protein product [Tuber melanosporum]
MSDKKRKREIELSSKSATDRMDALRRHFESQFAPLRGTREKLSSKKYKALPEKTEEELSDQEWEGIQGIEDDGLIENVPVVIGFDATKDVPRSVPKAPRSELKYFMSSKPPLPASSSTTLPTKSKKSSDDEEDPRSEAEMLKNDLALQRLLRESHLLDSTSGKLEATGKNRLKALESRIQALGGKDITIQKNVPMAIRKGIAAAREERELKRRKNAKEAGIVLERDTTRKKISKKRQDRGGFGPSIGRFKGGALVLSKRDVMDIEGRSGSGGGRGGKGGKKHGKTKR